MWTASAHASAPTEWAAAAIRSASGIEPTALEASVKATTRVRSPMQLFQPIDVEGHVLLA